MNYETDYAEMLFKATQRKERQTRNAITRSYFGGVLEINTLRAGFFPALLGRKMYWQGIAGEMAAFLQGPNHVDDFKSMKCNYWDGFAKENGDLILDYGNAWLDFNGVNQLETVVDSLHKDPYGRRHLISAWRPDRLSKLSLPCCHYGYQWYVNDEDELEMLWNQRSTDLAIGLPSDIFLAGLFNILMAQTIGLKPGNITMVLGDCHVYKSHLAGISTYLSQQHKVPAIHSLSKHAPGYYLDPIASVFNFHPSMFALERYTPQAPIKFKLEI